MRTKTVLRWLMTIIVFLATSVLILATMVFLLAGTPLHNGDDVPSPALFGVSAIIGLVVGIGTAWPVFRLRIWSQSTRTPPQ